jgi:penicillin-binding protein 1A
VWFGNDDSSDMEKVTGGSLPAMTWQRFMTEALDNTVSAPLVGVPVDDSYAKFVAQRAAAPEVLATRTEGAEAATMPAEEEVVISRSPARSEGVAGMFENLFGNRSQSQVRTSGRGQTADRNARRMRHVLESR